MAWGGGQEAELGPVSSPLRRKAQCIGRLAMLLSCWIAAASAEQSIVPPDRWTTARPAAMARRHLAASDATIDSSSLTASSPASLMSAFASVANQTETGDRHATILVESDIDLSQLSLHSSATRQPSAVLGSSGTLLIQGQLQAGNNQTCRYSSLPELGLGYAPGIFKYQAQSSSSSSTSSQTTASQQALLGSSLSSIRIVLRGLLLYNLPFGPPSTFPPGFLRLGLWMFDFGTGLGSRVSVTTLDAALGTSEARLAAQAVPLVQVDNCTLVLSQAELTLWRAWLTPSATLSSVPGFLNTKTSWLTQEAWGVPQAVTSVGTAAGSGLFIQQWLCPGCGALFTNVTLLPSSSSANAPLDTCMPASSCTGAWAWQCEGPHTPGELLYGGGIPGGSLKSDITPLWMSRLGSVNSTTSSARVALYPSVLQSQPLVLPPGPSPPSPRPPSPVGSGSSPSNMSDVTLSESQALARRYVLLQDGYLDPVTLNAQGFITIKPTSSLTLLGDPTATSPRYLDLSALVGAADCDSLRPILLDSLVLMNAAPLRVLTSTTTSTPAPAASSTTSTATSTAAAAAPGAAVGGQGSDASAALLAESGAGVDALALALWAFNFNTHGSYNTSNPSAALPRCPLLRNVVVLLPDAEATALLQLEQYGDTQIPLAPDVLKVLNDMLSQATYVRPSSWPRNGLTLWSDAGGFSLFGAVALNVTFAPYPTSGPDGCPLPFPILISGVNQAAVAAAGLPCSKPNGTPGSATLSGDSSTGSSKPLQAWVAPLAAGLGSACVVLGAWAGYLIFNKSARNKNKGGAGKPQRQNSGATGSTGGGGGSTTSRNGSGAPARSNRSVLRWVHEDAPGVAVPGGVAIPPSSGGSSQKERRAGATGSSSGNVVGEGTGSGASSGAQAAGKQGELESRGGVGGTGGTGIPEGTPAGATRQAEAGATSPEAVPVAVSPGGQQKQRQGQAAGNGSSKQTTPRAAAQSTRQQQQQQPGGKDQTGAGSPKVAGRSKQGEAGTPTAQPPPSLPQPVTDASTASKLLQGLMIKGEIGAGSSGIVYHGMWRGLRVAIKRVVLQAALLKEQENALSNTDTASRGGSTPPRPGVPPALQALLAEAAISQSLSHPNIVATYAADVRPLAAPGQVATMHAEGAVMGSQHLSEQTAEDSPTDWELILVQELCGGSVRSLIDGASPQDLRVVLGLLTQLASALAYMHAQGVVHGDVKPENALLGLPPAPEPLSPPQPTPQPPPVSLKLCDMGLSLFLGRGATHVSGAVQGTLLYTAPEVLVAGRVGRPADVYGWGMVAWELIHHCSAIVHLQSLPPDQLAPALAHPQLFWQLFSVKADAATLLETDHDSSQGGSGGVAVGAASNAVAANTNRPLAGPLQQASPFAQGPAHLPREVQATSSHQGQSTAAAAATSSGNPSAGAAAGTTEAGAQDGSNDQQRTAGGSGQGQALQQQTVHEAVHVPVLTRALALVMSSLSPAPEQRPTAQQLQQELAALLQLLHTSSTPCHMSLR